MADIIAVRIKGDRELQRKFELTPERLREEMRRGIGRAALMVARHSKQNKLSGQVLNVKTGRLRRSINTRMVESGDVIAGRVGTNVAYAKAHEFGWRGTVTVREHLRKTKSGFSATVRAHSRQVILPERSFLRSALADMKPEIQREFESAVRRAIKG